MKKLILVGLIALFAFGCGQKSSVNNATPTEKKKETSVSVLDKIQKAGVIRVGMEAGYLPFEFNDEKGNIIGFDVDLANELSKRMGVKVELINTAWDGIIPGLQAGKYDIIMSGMTRTLERALAVNFTDPYYVTGQVLLVRKGETRIKSYKDMDNKDFVLAVKTGTTSDLSTAKIIKNAKIDKYSTEIDGVTALKTKKADVFVYDKPYIEDYSEKDSEVTMLPELFTKEYFGFAIKKGDQDYLNWLNYFIEEIKADGTYDILYKKWFVDKEYKNKK